MAVKARRARQKAVLRREILDAARELFAREGYESVSMRKIAHKIDYSPTTIYLYFQDKFELLRGICEETFGKLAAQFDEIERTTQDPVERLKKAGRAYIEFGLRFPNHYRVTFMSAPEPQEPPGKAGRRPDPKAAGPTPDDRQLNPGAVPVLPTRPAGRGHGFRASAVEAAARRRLHG